jgi:glycine/D-amino acid oxidase-like deaminating enzyme
MKSFDFVVIGAGIAGLMSAYFLRECDVLLMDENDILSGASGAAGAFLFPKVGFDTKYTRFINDGIYEAVDFYKNLGIDTATKGVLILPRNEKDEEKFEKYEKEIKIPFEKKKGGFFFEIGSVVEPAEVKEKTRVNFLKKKVENLRKKDNFWIINDEIKTKNVILATGYKSVFKTEYLNIRAIWGERVKIKAKYDGFEDVHYHKNCSVQLMGEYLKIGATHKRDCPDCSENEEEALSLVEKAREIGNVYDFEFEDVKGGFRAASIDYFPVVGKIINAKKTLLNDEKIVKGDLPREIVFEEGLYIVNGMGARGFSNAVVCARTLRDFVLKNEKIPEYLDTKRLFVKWARKKGEEYLRRINA